MNSPITTFLWFNGNAQEVVEYYVSIFPESKINRTTFKPGELGAGSVMTIEFSLRGEEFIAFNGGPQFQFNEAISLMVGCDTQEEIDYYWEKLLEGGVSLAAGWLKDRYGLSWQITPREIFELMNSADQQQNARVMAAMNTMVKFDLETLRAVSRGDCQRPGRMGRPGRTSFNRLQAASGQKSLPWTGSVAEPGERRLGVTQHSFVISERHPGAGYSKKRPHP